MHLVAKRGQQRGKLFALRLLHVGLLHAQGFGRQQPELAGHFLAQLAQRRNLARGGFVILLRRQPGFGQLRAHLRDLLPGLVQRVGQPVAFLRQFAQARPLRLGTDLVLADLQFQRVNPAIGVLQSGLQRRLACPARRQGATTSISNPTASRASRAWTVWRSPDHAMIRAEKSCGMKAPIAARRA